MKWSKIIITTKTVQGTFDEFLNEHIIDAEFGPKSRDDSVFRLYCRSCSGNGNLNFVTYLHVTPELKKLIIDDVFSEIEMIRKLAKEGKITEKMLKQQ